VAGPNDSRRRFLEASSIAAGLAVLAPRLAMAASTTMKLDRSSIALPPLPFPDDALAPAISASTIGFHYNKHHKGYVDTVARMVSGTPMAEAALEEIVQRSAGVPTQAALFNAAAQTWNHNFYWRSLSPKQQAPTGKLAAAIERDFGSLDALKKALAAACVGQFGSGWGWLVLEGGTLKVVGTPNAEPPFLRNQTPLLTVDVWEHAYYLDYQNRRADHVNAVLDRHLNWAFASANLDRAT